MYKLMFYIMQGPSSK